MKKNSKAKKRNQKAFTPIFTGAALILLGFILFNMLNSEDRATAQVERSVVPMAVNYEAPPLALQNINGSAESLEAFRGKVVLLNNWATWCPPCKAEMPSLQQYYQTHKDEGFVLVAVNAGDPKPAVDEFVKNFGLTFHIWLDPNGEALQAFRNGSLPNSYVIDRAGIVRYAWTGEISLAMLEKFITPVLNEIN